jgi:riboflavin kinase/FMN adenylyltransferase
MAEEGIGQILILPFTLARSELSAEDFIRTIVVGRLGARAVLVGHNFRFGHQHAGNVALLQKLGEQFGFETIIVPAIGWRGRVVSSSGIRELILHGKVSLAARLLQSGYAMEGALAAGRGVGSKQTVPTLNLATTAEVIPSRGVYITHTRDLESRREWNSITNIGYRPTFGPSDELSIETFLLDPLEGEALRQIRVEFLRRIRDEKPFESPEALRAQILKDARAAQSYFRRVKLWIGRVPCISS